MVAEACLFPEDGAAPRRRVALGTLTTAPAVVYLIILTQLPFVVTLYLSLHRWNLLHPDRGISFVGLQNYIELVRDPVFRVALVNTVVFTVVAVIATTLLGLGIALLLFRTAFLRGLLYVLLLSPFLLMETVAPLIWKTYLLNPVYGLLDWLLSLFGIAGVDPLGQAPAFTVVTIITWQWTPFMMLIFLAGLQSRPYELVEAAHVEGARGFGVFRHVTLPHLRPFFAVGMLVEAILLLPLFGPIYVATYGGPGFRTANLTFDAYRLLTQQYEVGKAAACGVVTAVLTVIVTVILLRRMRADSESL
jgi:sorbitol/mannitol transport system permease protein